MERSRLAVRADRSSQSRMRTRRQHTRIAAQGLHERRRYEAHDQHLKQMQGEESSLSALKLSLHTTRAEAGGELTSKHEEVFGVLNLVRQKQADAFQALDNTLTSDPRYESTAGESAEAGEEGKEQQAEAEQEANEEEAEARKEAKRASAKGRRESRRPRPAHHHGKRPTQVEEEGEVRGWRDLGAAVYIVAQEEVVGLGREPAVLK
eukprot:3294601-Rhodomonas_salina.1